MAVISDLICQKNSVNLFLHIFLFTLLFILFAYIFIRFFMFLVIHLFYFEFFELPNPGSRISGSAGMIPEC